MMATLVDWLTAALLLLGAGFALLGSIGLARLPDIYTRLHGPTPVSAHLIARAALQRHCKSLAQRPKSENEKRLRNNRP